MRDNSISMTTRIKCQENIERLQAMLLETERRLGKLRNDIKEGRSGVIISAANYVADQGKTMMEIKEDV